MSEAVTGQMPFLRGLGALHAEPVERYGQAAVRCDRRMLLDVHADADRIGLADHREILADDEDDRLRARREFGPEVGTADEPILRARREPDATQARRIERRFQEVAQEVDAVHEVESTRQLRALTHAGDGGFQQPVKPHRTPATIGPLQSLCRAANATDRLA